MGVLKSISKFFGDVRILIRAARFKPLASDEVMSVGLMVLNNANAFPGDTALICEDESITWSEFNERSNRIGRMLLEQGIKKGDCVSLSMQNRIEFLVCLVGIVKIGGIVGLINTNLTKAPLTHCIKLIESKKCIFGEEQLESLQEVLDELNLQPNSDYLFVADKGENPCPNWAIPIDSTASAVSSENLQETSRVLTQDVCYYVFTSGTTGLPKAAIVTHKRCLPMGQASALILQRLTRKDRLYNCLPLYHATGLNMGWQATVEVGASMVIRRKLSVSAFWDDIRKYECTSFVYIGEFIRYLMSHPPQPNDRDNPIVKTVGNGLRPDIWMDFKERFDIPHVGEFYGASEGNSGFVNFLNKDLTVGAGVVPVVLAKYDIENDEVIRDEQGFCIAVEEYDPGLLLVKITDVTRFEGYTSEEATRKKVFENVLETGDSYFNTGDLLRQVDVGFAFGLKHYQFVDRVGDTFRWKSENVSTNEVGEIINSYPDVHMSNVYGVEIPGTDGRAGMATIILREGISSASDLDLGSFSRHITENLPAYANPIFIRLSKEQPTTATMKLQKSELRTQAFHPDKTSDEILVLKPGESVYQPLERQFYDKIMSAEARF
jgi:citronellyl-CoA synthetase